MLNSISTIFLALRLGVQNYKLVIDFRLVS
jgi:hypothetical protein